MKQGSSASVTFQRLRLIDRIGSDTISRGAASVLSLIARRSSGKWFEASGEFLAAVLKVSRRSIVRWVKELVAAGFLAAWRRVVREGDKVRASPNRYRVIAQAVVDAAAGGFAARRAAMVATMGKALAAVRRRVPYSDSVSLSQDQERKKDAVKGLWSLLASSREGSSAWDAAVAGLIEAGQAENPSDFLGMGA